MKDTIATTYRILAHLEAQRQLETSIPVELEHLVQLGSHVEDYLEQSVPFPDEQHKWEWLSSLGDTPQAKELADQPLTELFLYEPFLF